MREIPLTKGYVALVDDADYDRVNEFKWIASVRVHTVYARRNIRCSDGQRSMLGLHRFVLDAPDGFQVDHIDGDGLNNQRSNLRLATPAENARNRKIFRNNTSGYIGVNWDKERGKWCAQIRGRANGRQWKLWFARFDDVVEAARARDRKVLELHGEFASLNFPIEDYL